MKVLFIISSSIHGGAQKHVRDMFIEFSKKHNVYLIAPNGWLTDELKMFKKNVFVFKLGFSTVRRIRKIISTIKPDITNTFILSGAFYGTLAWKKNKLGKLFVTVNNPVAYAGITTFRKHLYKAIYRWLSKFASAFLTKSKEVKREVSEIIRSKKPVVDIKNAIDFSIFDYRLLRNSLRKELGIPNDSKIVLNVGALEDRKGQKYLIKAFASFTGKMDNCYLVLVGNGSKMLEYKDLALKESISNKVFFLGKRNDINILLSQADVFVFPSLHEGLPNALMEAMSMKVPCVVSAIPGCLELISDGLSGIVVNTCDCKQIENAIEWVLFNPDKAKLYSEAAYSKILNEYSLDAAYSHLEAVYVSIK